MSSGRKDRRQTTLFAYGTATEPKRIRLQDSTLPDRDSGTESDESAKINHDSDGSLSSESDDERETRHGKSGGNQSITVHAPTTVVMNNISTTTISRGCGRQSVHEQVPSDIASARASSIPISANVEISRTFIW